MASRLNTTTNLSTKSWDNLSFFNCNLMLGAMLRSCQGFLWQFHFSLTYPLIYSIPFRIILQRMLRRVFALVTKGQVRTSQKILLRRSCRSECYPEQMLGRCARCYHLCCALSLQRLRQGHNSSGHSRGGVSQ